ncbi:MAG: hypothetical protein H6624_16440 [Bdellovibrionaceae bacterium]|nr:hypothetical protein [Bdellovibrionales bacterium]MCB9085936.1 hypothetical protein [Pseudobdellovibrionaceae bacterium]
MLSKKLILSLSLTVLCTACTGGGPKAEDEENIIGNKLEIISDLSGRTGGTSQMVAIFDDTTRKIHQFDLQAMAHKRSVDVLNPEAEHFVLYHEQGDYIVDLTLKHISVYDKNGAPQHNPVTFQGKPLSAAFRPDLGFMVIYDDLMSVSILKMNNEGQVVSSWVSGPILENDNSIVSGDINDAGQLVLALSDDSLAVVDLEQTLTDRKWTFVSMATPMNRMRWLAPVPGKPDQVLVRAQTRVALFDLNTQTVLSEMAIDPDEVRVRKYSRHLDPHIILNKEYRGKEATLIYVADNEVKSRAIFHTNSNFMLSRLSLADDSWTYVTVDREYPAWNNTLNEVRETRSLRRYGFSSMLAQQQKSLPDKARLKLAPDYVFALFPSELGYAVRYGVDSDEKRELKLFNLRLIKD